MLIHADARAIPLRDGCVHCVVTSPPYWGLRDYGHGAQIGLESSPDDYAAVLGSVFSEVWRVLKPEGTLWLNLGDCYATGAGAVGECPGGGEQGARWRGDVDRIRDDKRGYRGERLINTNSGNIVRPKTVGRGARLPIAEHVGKHTAMVARGPMTQPNRMPIAGLKPKDLVGMPWRIAFMLQAAGWYLRSDIIWSKPNPMPESVTDRPTKAHEYLFLLTKSERYYYDTLAIAEPVSVSMLQQIDDGYDGLGLKDYEAAGVQNPSSVKARIIANAKTKQAGHGRRHDGFNERYFSPEAKHCRAEKNAAGRRLVENTKMARDGGSEHEAGVGNGLTRNKRTVWTVPTMPYPGAHFATMPEKLVEPCILAGCPLGGLVLDPFAGSGTVLAVAQRLGRRAVGVELAAHYLPLIQQRTAQRGLRFTEEAV